MELHEKVIRQLEDFVLHERDLKSVGNIEFEHCGKQELAYPYIRASNRSLVNALGALDRFVSKPFDQIRFLEVGCGIGTKCELARLIGMDSTGIDLLPEYVNLAKEIYLDCSFTVANAFEFDYSSYDVVYYHVPFFDEHLIQELEDRVLSQISVGSVLIATRISGALPGSLEEDARSISRTNAIRLPVEADVGRLIVLQKT